MPTFVASQIGKGTVLQAPTADGSADEFIKTDGSGNLSFGTPTASPAGSDTYVQFNDGDSALGGDANFTWSGTELVVGTTSTPAALNIVGPLGTDVTTPVFSSQLWSSGADRGTLAHYRGRPSFNNTDRSQVCFWPFAQTNDALFNGSSDGFTLSSSYAYGISSGDAESVAADVTLGRGSSGGFEATSTVTTAPVFVAKMPASHGDNAFEVQDSTAAVLSAIDVSGNIVAGGDGATPSANTVRGANGSGTDIAGANLTVAGGRGTGTGAGGHLIFQTAAAGGSGSSLNSLATMLELTDDSKIGFFAATPVVQQAGTGETTGFTAGSGTAVNDDSTFTGNVGATAYRISDIVKALKNYGLLAS